MSSGYGVRQRSSSGDVWLRIVLLATAVAAASCARSHEKAVSVETSETELALLLQDGELPSEMMQPPASVPPPVIPPRFCGGFGPGFPGVPGGPIVGAAGAGAPAMSPDSGTPVEPPTAADAGVAAADGGAPTGPDPLCAAQPIGFWRFDDCNEFRTDISDSSFEAHTAFRSVELTCAPGKQGLAPAFKSKHDVVYVPDQPAYALDFGVTIAAWVRPDSVSQTQAIFRKSEAQDSAFALLVHKGNYKLALRLNNGRLVSVAAPATAGVWTHVAGTYDGSVLRLYVNGEEVSQAHATGVLARSSGPLLMGNDGTNRRFVGRIDNAWFNTQAAPASTIKELLCLRRDPTVSVSPEVGPSVAAGTSVTYTLTITNDDDSTCPAATYQANASPRQGDFTFEPSFLEVKVETGQSTKIDFKVASGPALEPDSYLLDFSLFSNDSGGGLFFPGSVSIAPASSADGGVPTEPTMGEVDEDPIVPGPNGFASVLATYVVAEPTGCHVSSQRELMIRHVSVVEDPVRSVPAGSAPNQGVWSFAGLMQRLSPTPAAAADNAEAMFRSFLTPQTINTFKAPERTQMETLVLSSWPRTADGKLDLEKAPMRLLAITHRLDLVDAAVDKAGEGRFTFGVLDPMGNPMEFTVIFEYALVAKNAEETRGWIDAVHALQELQFPSAAYNDALQAVTDRYTERGVLPSAPNGSALIDIRTNEIALSFDGVWQLREFRFDKESGLMVPHPLFQTPDQSFNNQAALARFVNENEKIILTELHEAPAQFEGMPFQAAAVFNNIDFWTAPGITNPEARHKFSLNTCNGCHGSETGTVFLHISPRLAGEQSALSGYLTGSPSFDPVTGQQRRLSELGRRRGLVEKVVCPTGP